MYDSKNDVTRSKVYHWMMLDKWLLGSYGAYGYQNSLEIHFTSSGSPGMNIGSYSVILLWNEKVQLQSPIGGLWSPLGGWIDHFCKP